MFSMLVGDSKDSQINNSLTIPAVIGLKLNWGRKNRFSLHLQDLKQDAL